MRSKYWRTASRRPVKKRLRCMAARTPSISSRTMSMPRLVYSSVDRRVNTARVACSLNRLLSNSFFSISMRRIMWAITLWFLPRRLCSSCSCSAMPRARAAACTCCAASMASRSNASWRRMMSLRAGISSSNRAVSSACRRLFSSSAASWLILPTRAFCADTGNTWPASSVSRCATLACWRSMACATSASPRNSSHMLSILLSTTRRPAPAPIWLRQTSMSLRVTPVSAARINSTACAFGIRFRVSSGSVPMAFRPGVSRITRPCFSSGWGKLMMAWRHMEISTWPSSSSMAGASASSASYRP